MRFFILSRKKCLKLSFWEYNCLKNLLSFETDIATTENLIFFWKKIIWHLMLRLKSTWIRIVTSRFRRIWLDFLLCFIVPCFYCHQQTPFDWAVNTKVQRNELACDCAFYRNKRDVGSSQFHSTFHEAVILQHFWWVEDCQQDSKLTRR